VSFLTSTQSTCPLSGLSNKKARSNQIYLSDQNGHSVAVVAMPPELILFLLITAGIDPNKIRKSNQKIQFLLYFSAVYIPYQSRTDSSPRLVANHLQNSWWQFADFVSWNPDFCQHLVATF